MDVVRSGQAKAWESGFTLIEVIISIVLLAIILGSLVPMILGAYQQMLESRERLREAIAAQADMEEALSQALEDAETGESYDVSVQELGVTLPGKKITVSYYDDQFEIILFLPGS